jgi:hypothetical protein
MRNWSLAIATSALLTLTAAGSASAQDSDGFTTCKTVKQTSSGPFGTTSQSKKVCRSDGGFPDSHDVGFPGSHHGGGLGGGLGGGGLGGGGGGIHIDLHL